MSEGMCMNVEIITIHSMNYGNRLQNYALQEYLKGKGMTVRTSFGHKKRLVALRKIRDVLLKVYRKTDKHLFQFFDTKIQWKPIDLDPYCNDDRIDYYIAGSDQIWNPLFASCREDKFLTFAPQEKRIAYAASMGVDELPASSKEFFRERLLQFKAISVRETSAKQVIRDLCGLDVPVLLDPTLLLGADEWDKATRTGVLKVKEPFVVKYFLGKRHPLYEAYIEEYARAHGCKVIDITQHENCGLEGVGPDEFVQLFRHCQAAFVDSFHGTVFSVIFRKPFLTFARPAEEGFGDMNSRFQTLLGMLQLTDHYVTGQRLPEDKALVADYDAVHRIIARERKKTEEFFAQALS